MNLKKSVWIFCAAIVLGLCASAAHAQAVNASDQKALLLVGESVPTQPPQGMQASASLSNDILGQWNRAGSLLLGMAKDFPDDKMDYRPTPAVRTFAEQILHATVASKVFSDMAGGVMPKSFDEVEHPSRETYKTRQQIVDLIQKTFADGAAAIQKYGDKGLLEPVDSPFEKGKKVTRAWMFTFATAHIYDHYGQCVVYYRINGLVPPDSRQQ
jgi:uncharacterized damage-inducible protein DinB